MLKGKVEKTRQEKTRQRRRKERTESTLQSAQQFSFQICFFHHSFSTQIVRFPSFFLFRVPFTAFFSPPFLFSLQHSCPFLREFLNTHRRKFLIFFIQQQLIVLQVHLLFLLSLLLDLLVPLLCIVLSLLLQHPKLGFIFLEMNQKREWKTTLVKRERRKCRCPFCCPCNSIRASSFPS